MTTENPISDNEGKPTSVNNQPTENNSENHSDAANSVPEKEAEESSSIDIIEEKPAEVVENKTKKVAAEKVEEISTYEVETEPESETEIDPQLSTEEMVTEMEKLANRDDAGLQNKKFNQLKERVSQEIQHETEVAKQEFLAKGNPEDQFDYQHVLAAKVTALTHIFKEKLDAYHKKQDAEHGKNLENRQNIIDRLKNLYTNSEPGTNLFKEIRKIKEDWTAAGQVAKSDFKMLNNNYFHHLNQFYDMLDMNKEYLEQEYVHNLEKRQHIIARAKELENEPVVQKALNELQYLHKLWKEEAEPVAEEFREKTWEEFKEISNKIHERKSELSAQIDAEQEKNLERKNEIIAEIKKILEDGKEANHNYWQNAIKKIDDLRTEFLKIGSVPRKISNQNWNEFKQVLREFNNKKNDFYKNLKGSQHTNLEEKLKLIQTAKDNMHSEDWETAMPLFKKLQEDWKKIGHVPRSQTNKIWDEFRESCNVFFNNFREKTNTVSDNWKENYKLKKDLLEELKAVTDEEGSVEQIETIKTKWNSIGKVPREKITINTEFNKTLREKLRLNKMNEYELKEEGLSENQLTDKARKIKNQIADLESEIVKLENNLGFFNNPSRENPMLKETFDKIDEKKGHLENMKQNLHQIISGE